LEPDQLNTALGAIAQNRTQAVVSVNTAEYILCNNTIQLTVGTAFVGLLCPLCSCVLPYSPAEHLSELTVSQVLVMKKN